jgi:hypothetical protein
MLEKQCGCNGRESIAEPTAKYFALLPGRCSPPAWSKVVESGEGDGRWSTVSTRQSEQMTEPL